MATTNERLKELVDEHLDLGHEADFDAKFSDSGVSSVDAVAFIKVVNQEFNLTIPPEKVAQMQTLGDLAGYLDANAG
jgi:acyl carrier protein